jgi:CBS domain-containing protein
MNIGTICSRETIIAKSDDSLLDTARLMRKHHVGSLIIVNSDSRGVRPVGIITDRDIVIQAISEEIVLSSLVAGDIMSRDLLIAREDDDLFEAFESMCMKGVRRMPVVNDEGLLIGVLSVDDLLEVIVNEMKNLVHLFKHEQQKEQQIHTRA